MDSLSHSNNQKRNKLNGQKGDVISKLKKIQTFRLRSQSVNSTIKLKPEYPLEKQKSLNSVLKGMVKSLKDEKEGLERENLTFSNLIQILQQDLQSLKLDEEKNQFESVYFAFNNRSNLNFTHPKFFINIKIIWKENQKRKTISLKVRII